jgi:hypothetical protein
VRRAREESAVTGMGGAPAARAVQKHGAALRAAADR